MINKKMRRYKWKEQEDITLQAIMKAKFNQQRPGTVDWDEVHIEFIGKGFSKNLKQIKLRWKNTLCPSLNKSKWTVSEHQKLFRLYNKYGNRWKRIAEDFKGRTDNGIKNQFFSVIRRSLRAAFRFVEYDGDCGTTKVNRIRPKILTDFISGKGVIKGQIVQREEALKFMTRFAFSTYEEQRLKMNKKAVEYVKTIINGLLTLNSEYIGKRVKRKRIIKGAYDKTDCIHFVREKESNSDVTSIHNQKSYSTSYLDTPSKQNDIKNLSFDQNCTSKLKKDTDNQITFFDNLNETKAQLKRSKKELDEKLSNIQSLLLQPPDQQYNKLDRSEFNENLHPMSNQTNLNFKRDFYPTKKLKRKKQRLIFQHPLKLETKISLDYTDQLYVIGSPYANYVDFIDTSKKNCGTKRSGFFN